MASISERESREIEAAKASDTTPVGRRDADSKTPPNSVVRGSYSPSYPLPSLGIPTTFAATLATFHSARPGRGHLAW